MVQFINNPGVMPSAEPVQGGFFHGVNNALSQGLGMAMQNMFEEKQYHRQQERQRSVNTQSANSLADTLGLMGKERKSFVSQFANLAPEKQVGALKQLAEAQIYHQYLGGQQGQPQQDEAGGPMQPMMSRGNESLPSEGMEQAPSNAPNQIQRRKNTIPPFGILAPAAKIQQSQDKFEYQKEQDELNRAERQAKPFVEEVNTSRKTIPIRENALRIAQKEIEKNPGREWGDWIIDATGLEPLRGSSSAVIKNATKEFFLGSLSRAGARPNQWIEQKIEDMMIKIGRTQQANLAVSKVMEFPVDLEKKRVEIFDKIADEHQDRIPGNIDRLVDKEMKPYVEQRENELAYDLKNIEERYQSPEELNSIKTVPPGTPLTLKKAKVFFDRAGGDEAKALKAARAAGYTIVDKDIYKRDKDFQEIPENRP